MCGDPTGDPTEPSAESRRPERGCRLRPALRPPRPHPRQQCDGVSRFAQTLPAAHCNSDTVPVTLRIGSMNNIAHRLATHDVRAQGALTSIIRGSSSQRRGRTFGTKASYNPGGEGRTRK